MRRFPSIPAMAGLLVLATATTATAAVAQVRGACGQIRVACIEAGFIQGAVAEGVGLQVHCVTPIMQGRPQPPSARRRLPKVSAQLVADCQASRMSRFGRALLPEEDVILPPREVAVPPPPAANPHPTPGGRTAVAAAGQDILVRPPRPMTAEQRAIISALPPEDQPETGPAKALPPQLRRSTIDYPTKESVGTIIIDTSHTYLYLVLRNGKAMRYGIGVGREGFTWSGAEKVTKMAEWPDWHPPEEMIARQPYLPRFMAGGDGNPLGARALYLGQTLYRIHGTNQPSTIGTFVSSGCIRLTNEDITDLYGRVQVGTRVVVLPASAPASVQATVSTRPAAQLRPQSNPSVAEKPAPAPTAAAPSQPAAAQAAPARGQATGMPARKDTRTAIAAPPAAAVPSVNEEE